MKNFLKKIAVFCGIIIAVSATFNFTQPSQTLAKNIEGTTTQSKSGSSSSDKSLEGSCRYLLGMVSWDCNASFNGATDQELPGLIAQIALNILTDLTVIAAYLVLGYVIYGGYLYMFSSGDPGKAAAGKKALTHAFIGLAIVISAYTIFGAIRVALIGNQSLADCDPLNNTCVGTDANVMVTNLIQWVVGIAGVVAAVFLVIGAWSYITAAGDPNKLAKAKNTILYALIGLVAVALAEILTAFISGIVRDANGSDAAVIQNTDSTAIVININKETT